MKVFSNLDYDLIRKLVLEYLESEQDLNELLDQLLNRIELPEYLWQLDLRIEHENLNTMIDELYDSDIGMKEDKILWVILLIEALHSVEWAFTYAMQANTPLRLKVKYKTALLMDLSNELIPAIDLCKGIIDKYPDYQVVYTLLGSLSAATDNTEDVIKYYSQAIQLDPVDYWVRHSYSVWCINQRDYYAAINQLEVALQLNPTSSLSWFQLAQAYHLIGDKTQSEEALNKAKDLGFDIVDSFE